MDGIIQFSQITFKNGKVTLRAYVPSGEVDYVTIAGAESYRAGDRFTFELVCPETVDIPKSVTWYFDDEPVMADSVTLTRGAHTVEAHLTDTAGNQSVVTLEIVANAAPLSRSEKPANGISFTWTVSTEPAERNEALSTVSKSAFTQSALIAPARRRNSSRSPRNGLPALLVDTPVKKSLPLLEVAFCAGSLFEVFVRHEPAAPPPFT